MDITEALVLDYETIIKETEKAYEIKFSTTEICWIPKSQCRIFNGDLYVVEWIVKNNGLEQFIITDIK